ncbi:hypothetical protein KAW18_18640 [candidate division WOR-3 bacterium]|nr:hypothetical protein [candidate division WOR-3 bacterium]
MQSSLREEIRNLKKREELKIIAWEVTEDEIMLFVKEINEENKKLEGQWINGREVRIAVLF